MTRITNFGRKRTYLEAGLSSCHEGEPAKSSTDPESPDGLKAQHSGEAAPSHKKKRKRTKMSMRDGNTGVKAAEAAAECERRKAEAEARKVGEDGQAVLSKSAKKKKRAKDKKQQVFFTSEGRRQIRIHDKQAATICFACREKGHSAKDCATAKDLPTEDGKKTSIVGICYRCGSEKHTLSRCKTAFNETNPLPFASCFVCQEKGHLASSCPQNKAKGVYPDGGCCKLCGDTSHLARNCGLQKRDVVDTSAIFGTGSSAGADEDDFHWLNRRINAVDRDDKHEEEVKRSISLNAGADFLKVPRKLSTAPLRKVVNF